jgi:hypothetical protein
MSNLFEILEKSFRMLLERPVLFIPRLISSTISSAAMIFWILGWIDTFTFLAVFPIVGIVGSFTPIMVSSMVEKESKKKLLRKGFIETLGLWKQILGFTMLTFVLAFINSIPLSLGLIASINTGNPVYVAGGLLISLIILISISFGLYFVPISLIKEGKLFKGIGNAIDTSNENRKEVTLLILFSLAVLGISSTTTGYLRDIGLSIFFIGRMASSVVGTYLLVISPQYYLSESEER